MGPLPLLLNILWVVFGGLWTVLTGLCTALIGAMTGSGFKTTRA